MCALAKWPAPARHTQQASIKRDLVPSMYNNVHHFDLILELCSMMQEAVERALEDNTELAAEFGAAARQRARAAAAKEQGNDAFKAKDFAEALKHYSVAIAADNSDATYFSNRCFGACAPCTLSVNVNPRLAIGSMTAAQSSACAWQAPCYSCAWA